MLIQLDIKRKYFITFYDGNLGFSLTFFRNHGYINLVLFGKDKEFLRIYFVNMVFYKNI